MDKSNIQTLPSGSKNFPKEFEIKVQNNIEIKEKEIVIAETIAIRDFSSVFARLKRSTRKKSAGIL